MMKAILGLCVGVAAVVMIGSVACGGNYYVSAVAAPGGDGTRGSPLRTIQEGINIASPAGGDTVIVLPGVYPEHVDFLTKDVVVQSEYPTNPGVVSSTIIDGTDTGTAVTIAGGQSTDAALAGFTIRNGRWDDQTVSHGGGVHIENASPTVLNNVITANDTSTDGGGIAVVGESLPVILDNTISDNEAGGWGGGIFIFGDTSDPEDVRLAAPQVVGNRVTGNQAEWDGGGIACFEACAPTLKANVIDNNSAGEVGGGLFVGFGVQVQMQNLTLADNHAVGSDVADPGGPIARVGRGGGLAWWHGGTATANSCIFWDGTAKDDEGPQISLEGGSSSTIVYCDVQGGQTEVFAEAGATLTWAGGNLNTDPLFATEAGDYHLQSTAGRFDPATGLWVTDTQDSPMIDAADAALDWEDEPAPHGRRANMGGYGTTPQASKSAGLPITIVAWATTGWVYCNTPTTTLNRHKGYLIVDVLEDYNSNTEYTIDIEKIGGAGEVSSQPGPVWQLWYLVGGQRVDNPYGPCDLRVTVSGNTAGVGTATTSITVRQLGDIDGDGSVTGTDKQMMNQRLNLVETPYSDREFDLTGDETVTGTDKQVMNMVLNNAEVP